MKTNFTELQNGLGKSEQYAYDFKLKVMQGNLDNQRSLLGLQVGGNHVGKDTSTW